MAVITISRTGSLGEEIGKMVSDRLGYRLVYREVINQAAFAPAHRRMPSQSLMTLVFSVWHPQ